MQKLIKLTILLYILHSKKTIQNTLFPNRILKKIPIISLMTLKISQVLPRIPFLVMLFIGVYFTSLYLSYEDPMRQQSWHYYINGQQFSRHPSWANHSSLNLQHLGEGHYAPIQMTIKTRSATQHSFLIDDINHTHIDQAIPLSRKHIQHAILKSDHPLVFHQNQKGVRLLQTDTDDPFVTVCGNFFEVLMPLIRNLIMVGALTNNVDLFLPVVLSVEMVQMLALLDNSKHFLEGFYFRGLNSNLDLFSMIRVNIFGGGQVVMPKGGDDQNEDTSTADNTQNKDTNDDNSNTGKTQEQQLTKDSEGDQSQTMINQQSAEQTIAVSNPLLVRFGYTDNLFYNISGELVFLVVYLAITVFIKAGATLVKIEKLRQVSAHMRAIWNGVMFCLMPRVLTFSSFTLRNFDFESGVQGLVYPLIAVFFCLAYIVYFVTLLLQIRRINKKVEFLQESHSQIGLVSRLDYRKDFQFDCLQYSNLYYPIMNFLRVFIFFFPIGVFYDMTYVSFGGTITAQLLYVMLCISSSGYVRSRDGIIYPFCDFLIIVLILSYISVGLAESVHHSEASVIAEQVYFSMLLTIMGLSIGSICFDISIMIRNKCEEIKEQSNAASSLEKDMKSIKKGKKNNVDSKTTVKTRNQKEDFSGSQNNDDDEDDIDQDHKQRKHSNGIDTDSFESESSAINLRNGLNSYGGVMKSRVRKVRKGKIV